ncbi:MAG: hypothetical protein IJY62_02640 [Clostridia bacterium]|nr:hypothetical protein [Clostridia bacterium]
MRNFLKSLIGVVLAACLSLVLFTSCGEENKDPWNGDGTKTETPDGGNSGIWGDENELPIVPIG